MLLVRLPNQFLFVAENLITLSENKFLTPSIIYQIYILHESYFQMN